MEHFLKNSYENKRIKIQAPRWNEKFELPDGFHSVSDIQDIFEYIIRNYETRTDNPPVKNM